MFCLWLSLPSALATQMYCAAQLASQHQAMYVIKWLHHRLYNRPQLYSFFNFLLLSPYISCHLFFHLLHFWHLASLHPLVFLRQIFKMLLIRVHGIRCCFCWAYFRIFVNRCCTFSSLCSFKLLYYPCWSVQLCPEHCQKFFSSVL
jgi:hypothetical protein